MSQMNCPSGIVAEVRKIKGHELVALAEQAEKATGDGALSTVIGSCWISTLDPGPYALDSTGKPNPHKMLKGDVLSAFVHLRRISLGDAYEFPVKCESCNQRYVWEVDLSTVVAKTKALPKTSAEKFKAGELFETTIRGAVVRFDLQKVTQEEPMHRLIKQQKRSTVSPVDALVAQIVAIDGVRADDMEERWKFVADLDMDELTDLREAFEDVDCGIDTTIQTKCTNRECRWEQDTTLPFGKTFFSRPKRAKKV